MLLTSASLVDRLAKPFRRAARNERHIVPFIRGLRKETTTWLEHARDLVKHRVWVFDVLHDVVRKDNIEGRIGIRNDARRELKHFRFVEIRDSQGRLYRNRCPRAAPKSSTVFVLSIAGRRSS